MRALFVHDNRFDLGPDDRFYSTGSFPSSLWERYLLHFDDLHVLARRGIERQDVEGLACSSHGNVSFEFAPDIGSPRNAVLNGRQARAQIAGAVAAADAVIVRVPSEFGFLAAHAATRLGKPLAVEVAGCAWDAAMHHGSPLLRAYAPLFFHRMRRVVADAPLVLYVTSEWLQRRYPTRGYSVASSNVEIVPLTPEDRARRQQRLASLLAGRPLQLGTVGALTPMYKGIDVAFRALARLRRAGLELPYAILGAGDPEPWRARACDLGIGHLVRFEGTRQAGDGVRRWLDQIDVHLQPSFAEGLPRATIEAMSRGVACLGSGSGGIPELLPPAQVHRRGDADSLSGLIRHWVENPRSVAEAVMSGIEDSRRYLPETLSRRRQALYGRLRALADAGRG